MKDVITFLTEREIKGTKVGFSEEKTQELLNIIGINKLFDIQLAIEALSQGAEPTLIVLSRLFDNLSPSHSKELQNKAKELLLYIKDNFNIKETLTKDTNLGTTLSQVPFSELGSMEYPLLKWIIDNGFVIDINQVSKNGNTLLCYVVTSNDNFVKITEIKKCIDLLLKHGANINDKSFRDSVLRPKVLEYLIKKGRDK